ncbi:MAG TPA: glycosyltransferase family 1 protein, partial [bacterium (Candidatus Stahlbacteria)]|nr:glycosyltransferase family 1 protein [Candidatus Stahlbacteria bacterium]
MICLVVPHGNDFLTLRQPLLRRLIQVGFDVLTVAPPGPWAKKVKGCQKRFWHLGRGSLNPKSEGSSVSELYRIYKEYKPTLVHHFTIKPNIYGTIAARLAGVPLVVNTVTGLGYFWVEDSLRCRLIRTYLSYLYRLALNLADGVIFQNRDDLKLLKGNPRSLVIPGEGVEIDQFDHNRIPKHSLARLRQELNLNHGDKIVLLVSRMLWHKGVGEYVAAASMVRKKIRGVAFLLVGPADPENPAGVPLEQLKAWDDEGVVRYLGRREDIRELMAIADLFVLPTYYREGIPRVLIEA